VTGEGAGRLFGWQWTVFGVVEGALTFTVFLYVAYFALLGIPGVFFSASSRRDEEEAPGAEAATRFLILVAAHNEEAVIGEAVANILSADYPPHSRRVVVVCDNCTDRTAAVAAKAGAEVWVRTDPVRRGKAPAIRWALERGLRTDDWTALVILDADNLIDPHLLRAFDRRLARGEVAVQAYLDSKNPTDSWVSLSYAMAYWSQSRLFQLARHRLGLSCQLGGTGYCLSRPLLEEMGWNATSLTEDVEFTTRLVMSGRRVTWLHEARIYDEKPVRFPVAWRQRVRWMQGHTFVSTQLTGGLLRRILRTGDLAALDALLYLWAPTLQFASFVWAVPWLLNVVLGLPLPIPYVPYVGMFAALAIQLVPMALALARERRAWALRGIVGYLLAGVVWTLTVGVGWAKHRHQGTWVHTPHSRALSRPITGPAAAAPVPELAVARQNEVM
jgi:cellulose synthase/poly-beta-1,6-N-acetylglucosamine synthase-like glycosyltransferase